MDQTDIELIKTLQEHGRMTLSDLSKRLNLSRPSVSERMNKLMDQGVIEGFSARISYPKIGKHVTVFIQVSDLNVSYETFEKYAQENPDIIECHRITGAISYMLKAVLKDMQHLEALIDELVPFGTLNTSVVVKSPVPHKHVTPAEADE